MNISERIIDDNIRYGGLCFHRCSDCSYHIKLVGECIFDSDIDSQELRWKRIKKYKLALILSKVK